MKKILIAFDGSPTSEKAAEKAIDIAKRYGSEVTFISVVDVPLTNVYDSTAIDLPIEYSKVTKRIVFLRIQILNTFIDKIDCEGIIVKKVVLPGVPYEEIINYAKEESFDLIVMGRRGFSKIKRFFVGSETQRVISDSPCNVLVVNEV